MISEEPTVRGGHDGAPGAHVRAVHVDERTRERPATSNERRTTKNRILDWIEPLRAAGVEAIAMKVLNRATTDLAMVPPDEGA